MNPIKTGDSNFVYRGPTMEIADLYCWRAGRDTFATFKLTDEERKLVAEGGHIRLGIYGMCPIPPVSLCVVAPVGLFKEVPAPCRVCGNPSDNPVHLTGPGTHAYKV